VTGLGLTIPSLPSLPSFPSSPYLSLTHPLFPFPLPSPSLPSLREGLGSAVSSLSGVWGGAPTEIELGSV